MGDKGWGKLYEINFGSGVMEEGINWNRIVGNL